MTEKRSKRLSLRRLHQQRAAALVQALLMLRQSVGLSTVTPVNHFAIKEIP